MLTDPDILRAWEQYRTLEVHRDWQMRYRSVVERFAAMSRHEFDDPAVQRELWDPPIADIGKGRSVTVDAIVNDAATIEALWALPRRNWPTPADERATAIQAAFDEIMALVHGRLSKRRPRARLLAAFAVLLPRDTNSILTWGDEKRLSMLLLGHHLVGGSSRAQSLARSRLRGVLGDESPIGENVGRATFCWWLQENYDALIAGREPAAASARATAVEPRSEAAVIDVWPLHKQTKGLFRPRGMLDAYRCVLRHALDGSSLDDLVAGAANESPDAESPAVWRQVARDLLFLGLLERRDALLHPTTAGEEVLETDELDPLIERVLQRALGFAHVLRLLTEAPGGLTRSDLAARLQAVHSGWTTTTMPYAIISWTAELGLLMPTGERRQASQVLVLSDAGRDWSARLPATLPTSVPTGRDSLDEDIQERSSRTRVSVLPAANAIIAQFQANPDLSRFVFGVEQIAWLHAAWLAHEYKRFVLLSGLSGTGKTELARRYAQAACEVLGLDWRLHFTLVPVSPDWMDPSGVLGYLNALHSEPTYRREPALELILRAHENPEVPFFLVLDEMNLAPVERWFAPFLSAMETGDHIDLHAESVPVNGVPKRIEWPENLHIAGTVNMDESTHAFSDKVLDRAFTLEFWDVDLPTFFARNGHRDEGLPELGTVETVLLGLHDTLRPVRRHFGYRTAREILGFVSQGLRMQVDGVALPVLLDQAVFSKVLPKLRGEDRKDLRDAIELARSICANAGLVRCEAKLAAMHESLVNVGIARFWS